MHSLLLLYESYKRHFQCKYFFNDITSILIKILRKYRDSDFLALLRNHLKKTPNKLSKLDSFFIIYKMHLFILEIHLLIINNNYLFPLRIYLF